MSYRLASSSAGPGGHGGEGGGGGGARGRAVPGDTPGPPRPGPGRQETPRGAGRSEDAEPPADREVLADGLRQALARVRRAELERGVCLVGPHRDELELRVGELPARGYASHGESWSLALALRLAAYDLLRSGGEDPVLILDDVLAELDSGRPERLAALLSGARPGLGSAAVPAGGPAELCRRRC